MQLSKKNSLTILAGILVVTFGYIALSLSQTKPSDLPNPHIEEIKKIETQSASDSLESIEKDLTETDLSDIDQELQDIERELEMSL